MNSIQACLRLASSQLPIGGYSYSQNLEAASDNGWMRDTESAWTWLADQLQLNLTHFEVPLLAGLLCATLIGDWVVCGATSGRHRASRETHELAQESQQMGLSLHQLLEALPELSAPGRAWLARRDLPSLAAAWTMAVCVWRPDAEEALNAWFWSWLENQLVMLVKTLPLGQLAAQKLASSLLPELDRACAEALRRPAVEGNAAFSLALAGMTRKTQYSRLLRSQEKPHDIPAPACRHRWPGGLRQDRPDPGPVP